VPYSFFFSNESYKGMLMLVYHSPSSSDAEFMGFLEETCCNELLNGRYEG